MARQGWRPMWLLAICLLHGVAAAGTGCQGYMGTLSSASDLVLSNPFPIGWSQPVECRWVYRGGAGSVASFQLTSGSFEPYLVDRLVIFDGVNRTDTELVRYSASAGNGSQLVYASSPDLTIILYAEAGLRAAGRAFSMTIKAPAPPPVVPCSNGSTTYLTVSGATFLTPWVPRQASLVSGLYFPRSWSCRFVLDVAPTDSMYLAFSSPTSLNVAPSDTLTVTDIGITQNTTYTIAPINSGLVSASNGRLVVEFTTGPEPNLRFMGWLTQVMTSVGRPVPCDGSEVQLTDPNGVVSLFSTGLPAYTRYLPGTTCSFLICTGVEITINGSVFTEAFVDSLEITNEESGSLVASLSGNMPSIGTHVSVGSSPVRITFRAAPRPMIATNNTLYFGFQLFYYNTPGAPPTYPSYYPGAPTCLTPVTTITAETGTFGIGTVGDFAHPYFPNLDCGFIITVPKGNLIRLNLQSSIDSQDQLLQYVGRTPSDTNLANIMTTGTSVYYSADNTAYVRFRTDGRTTTNWGFKITFVGVPGLRPCQPHNNLINATSSFFPSFGYPATAPGIVSARYLAGVSCEWIVDVGAPITLIVVGFSLTPGDKLTIYNGTTTSAPVVYSGADLEGWDLIPVPGAALIRFDSDDSPVYTNGFGFQLAYRFQTPRVYLKDGAYEQPFTFSPTIFHFPEVSEFGTPYSGAHAITWTTTGPVAWFWNSLRFNNEIHLSDGDYLELYDGADTSAPIITRLTAAATGLKVLPAWANPSCNNFTLRVVTQDVPLNRFSGSGFNMTAYGVHDVTINGACPKVPGSVVCSPGSAYSDQAAVNTLARCEIINSVVTITGGTSIMFTNLTTITANGGISVLYSAGTVDLFLPKLVTNAGYLCLSPIGFGTLSAPVLTYSAVTSLAYGPCAGPCIATFPSLKYARTIDTGLSVIPRFPALVGAYEILLQQTVYSPVLDFNQLLSAETVTIRASCNSINATRLRRVQSAEFTAISSLRVLNMSRLAVAGDDLTIKANLPVVPSLVYAGCLYLENLDGVTNSPTLTISALQHVFAVLCITELQGYTTISFPSLIIADCIDVYGSNSLTTLNAPQLISGGITTSFSPLLTFPYVPNLKMSPSISIQLISDKIDKITVPALQYLNQLVIVPTIPIKALSFPNLVWAGYVCLRPIILSTVDFPLLRRVDNILIVSTQLKRLTAPLLTNFYAVDLLSNTLFITLEMPSLEAAEIAFTLTGSRVATLSLPSLYSVGNNLQLTNNKQLSILDICALRIVGQAAIAVAPELSCFETRAVFAGMPLTMNDTECNTFVQGNFGCARNFTRVVNTTLCGYTVACIQASITATLGDADITVFVPSGLYTGCDVPLTFLGRSMVLRGMADGSSVIDCQGNGTALAINQGEGNDTIITSLVFRNGRSSTRGGLFSIEDASPTFIDVSFSGGWAATDGGAGVIDGGQPTFTRCTFTHNEAFTSNGGALLFTGEAAVSMQDCTFSFNTAAISGGGLALVGAAADARLVNTVFLNNTAARGGAIFADGGASLLGGVMHGNVGVQYGGAVAAVPVEETGVTLTMEDMSVESNSAKKGGALYLYSCSLLMRNSTLVSNVASTSDGAAINAACSVEYRELTSTVGPCPNVISVEESSMTGNVARGGNGGAVYAENVVVYLMNATLSGNSAAQNGGGVAAVGANLTVHGAQITGNAVGTSGGGVYCEASGACHVLDSSITANSGKVAGGGLYYCALACLEDGVPAMELVTSGTSITGNHLAAGGYGDQTASDPTRLTWTLRPRIELISGELLSDATDATLRLVIQDAFAQTVLSGINVLQLVVADTAGVTQRAVLGGSAVALASQGNIVFTSTAVAARTVADTGRTYQLTCRHSTVASLVATAPFTILPCATGQGADPARINSSIVCQDCAAGTYVDVGTSLLCVGCPAGSFNNVPLQTSCTACPIDTFQPATGATQCVPCAGQSHAQGGATACTNAAVDAPSSIAGVALDVTSPTVYGVLAGVLVLLILLALLIGRIICVRTRRKTLEKYYIDQDATVRRGTSESALAMTVRKMIGATTTTRIGGGQFTDVYKAKHNDEWIAIKVLRGEALGNSFAQTEFQHEVVILSTLSGRRHPSIVDLKFYLEKAPVCIGLEFCSQGSLKKQLGILRLTVADKVKMMAQVASAMGVMHSYNFIHMDLKTDNILLDDNGTPKVADFGISRMLNAAGGSTRLGTIRAARFESMMGSRRGSVGVASENPVFEDESGAAGGAEMSPLGERRASVGAPLLDQQRRGSNGAALVDARRPSVGGRSRAGSEYATEEPEAVAFTPQYVDPYRLLNETDFSEQTLKRADVFTFGMTMWALYSQQEPFAGIDAATLMQQRRDDPMLRPPPIVDCHACYERIMTSAWHHEPHLRPSINDCFTELCTCLRDHFNQTLDPAYHGAVDSATSVAPAPASISPHASFTASGRSGGNGSMTGSRQSMGTMQSMGTSFASELLTSPPPPPNLPPPPSVGPAAWQGAYNNPAFDS